MINFKTLIYFICVISFLGCGRGRSISDYQDIKIAEHWMLKLPGSIEEVLENDAFYQKVYKFSTDSLILKTATAKIELIEALANYDFAATAEKKGSEVGFCLGGFEGEYKFENFINASRNLSGIFLDLEEEGKWEVNFRVEHSKTGERLDLLFASINQKQIRLMHSILRNIEFIP